MAKYSESEIVKMAALNQRKAVGTQLRELRKAKGFSPLDVSVITGIFVSQISKDERGINNITLDRLILYSSIYGSINICADGDK